MKKSKLVLAAGSLVILGLVLMASDFNMPPGSSPQMKLRQNGTAWEMVDPHYSSDSVPTVVFSVDTNGVGMGGYAGGTASQSTQPVFLSCVTTYSYTSAGDVITFSAPFTDVPAVVASVVPTNYSAYTNFNWYVTSLSKTGCTIRVNYSIPTSIALVVGEAPASSVKVTVVSIGK